MSGPHQEADLFPLGWDHGFSAQFADLAAPGHEPARVVFEHARMYRVVTAAQEYIGELAGRLRHTIREAHEYPVVGDWVAIAPVPGEAKATIHGVLPRRSKFSRKVSGDTTEEQVVAANIDTVFLMTGLDRNFNPRRIERYLLLAWTSGANPVIVLTKADIALDLSKQVQAVQPVAAGVPIHTISAATGAGVDELDPYLVRGRTLALLGSSGVGKSTLINRWLGQERLRTGSVRDKDGRGRHTTTHRELIMLPSGAMVIDTPGMRELQLWDSAEQSIGEAFADIHELAADCRFRDCRHEGEPGCAVKQAVAEGRLLESRFDSYQKVQKELGYLERRQDQIAQQGYKRKVKTIMKAARRHRPRS